MIVERQQIYNNDIDIRLLIPDSLRKGDTHTAHTDSYRSHAKSG
jgi:hypothetical protein